jgi:hypothetical protein
MDFPQDPHCGGAPARAEQRILNRWEASVRETLGPAAPDGPALINSIPDFLDSLARTLASSGPGRR